MEGHSNHMIGMISTEMLRRPFQETCCRQGGGGGGGGISTYCFVDSDHVGNTVTRRSQTGLFLFVNRALTVWYSKHQNTVETSTFGSEFIAIKTVVEQIEALRYKLRMFSILLEGPTNIFCDNESVFKNA